MITSGWYDDPSLGGGKERGRLFIIAGGPQVTTDHCSVHLFSSELCKSSYTFRSC